MRRKARSAVRTLIASAGISFAIFLCALASAEPTASVASRPRLAPLPADYEVLDQIVALVDDTLVTLWEVSRAAQLNRAAAAAVGKPLPEGEDQQQALEALVDEALVLSEAKELALQVSDAEIDNYFRRIKAQSGWDDNQLQEAVLGMGFGSMRAYRDHTMKEMIKARTFSYKVGSRVNVGMAEVQRVLDEDYEGGRTSPEVRVRTLLRRVAPEATEDQVAEAYRMAVWLQQQASAAPEVFGNLVMKFSEDESTRQDQGDLGWIRQGHFEDAGLESALFSTPSGQITPIVRTRDGFRFFQIAQLRRAPIRDLEGLKNTIYDRLVEQEQERIYKAWMRELRETHYVEIRK